MKSTIMKALVLTGIGVFLAGGITTADAKSHGKNFRVTIGEDYREYYGTNLITTDKDKKHKRTHKVHQPKTKAERSAAAMRSESSNN